MRYLCIYRPAAQEGAPPTAEEMTSMGQFIQEMSQAGILLAAEGCMPSVYGTRVRLTEGKFTVTDGPFTESKELVAGFALIQVESKEEALKVIKRFLEVAGDGESEVRLLYDQPAL